MISDRNTAAEGTRRQMRKKIDDYFDAPEAARRRDEVIRRMANTPPQPRTKAPLVVQKRERKLARIARLVRAARAVSVRPERRSVG